MATPPQFFDILAVLASTNPTLLVPFIIILATMKQRSVSFDHIQLSKDIHVSPCAKPRTPIYSLFPSTPTQSKNTTLVPQPSKVFLELGDAGIHYDAFDHITDTSGYEAWMRGETMDMALETLRRDLNCGQHSIDIANSNLAQVFYLVSLMSHDEARQACYNGLRNRFADRRWIFLVVNDGIGEQAEGTRGAHWTLVGLNRQQKKAHYYDSLNPDDSDGRNTAGQVVKGLLMILNETNAEWQYLVEAHTPHQVWNNSFIGDYGPCGPFVYKITEMLIHEIKEFQLEGKEREFDLARWDCFPSFFESCFDSAAVRHHIRERIKHWKDTAVPSTAEEKTPGVDKEAQL